MPTRNINLTGHFDKFIDRQVNSGRYGNASEIVREGLRLLEEREKENAAKLRALRDAAKEGFDAIDRGEGIVIHDKRELSKFMNEVSAEVKRARMARRAKSDAPDRKHA